VVCLVINTEWWLPSRLRHSTTIWQRSDRWNWPDPGLKYVTKYLSTDQHVLSFSVSYRNERWRGPL